MADSQRMEELKNILKYLRTDGSGLPSIGEMRSNQILKDMLVSDADINTNKASFYNLIKAKPKIQCLAPTSPPCKNKPINSHSIQKSGPVMLLSNSNNHVVMLNFRIPNFEDGPKVLAELVGVNQASAFPGLCAKHDCEVFSDIDREISAFPSKRQSFLFSYRALLREVYAKKRQFKLALDTARKLGEDKPNSPIHIATIMHAHQVYLGDFFLDRIKRKFESAYLNGIETTSLKTKSFLVDYRLPFSCAGHFTPKFSFDGERIKPKGDPMKVGLPWMAMSVIPETKHSIIAFCWDDEYTNELNSSLGTIKKSSNDEISAISWKLALREIENIIIQPDSWKSLSKLDQDTVCEFFKATIYEDWVPWCGVTLSGIK